MCEKIKKGRMRVKHYKQFTLLMGKLSDDERIRKWIELILANYPMFKMTHRLATNEDVTYTLELPGATHERRNYLVSRCKKQLLVKEQNDNK